MVGLAVSSVQAASVGVVLWVVRRSCAFDGMGADDQHGREPLRVREV